jgi:hypothetical protein
MASGKKRESNTERCFAKFSQNSLVDLRKNHEWQTGIATRAKGSGCPFCSRKIAAKDNNLQVLNPKLSEQWHPTKNGHLTPKSILPGAHRKVWWTCDKGHEWKAFVFSRNKGTGCPYCYRKKRLSV